MCHAISIFIEQTKFILCIRITLFCRFPKPFHGFFVILFCSFSIIVAFAQFILCSHIALLCGFPIPENSLARILFHTKSGIVAVANAILCDCYSLFCGFFAPHRSLFRVFFYAFSCLVAIAKIILRPCKSLLCGSRIPLSGLYRVFCYTIAIHIANAQIVLRSCIALFCRLAVAFKCLFQIFCNTCSIVIAVAQFFLRFRISLLCGLFVPHDRIFFIFFHTSAVLIAPGHFKLCLGASVITGRNHVLLKRHLGIADLLKITGILQIVLLGFLLRFLLRFLTQTKALHAIHKFSLFVLRPIELKAVHGIFLTAETHSLDLSPQTVPIHTASRRFKPFFNRFCLDGIRDFHVLPTHTDRLQFIRKTYFHLNFAHDDSLPMCIAKQDNYKKERTETALSFHFSDFGMRGYISMVKPSGLFLRFSFSFW